MRAERLAQEVAERVRERGLARRVEVTIAARFPERRPAPVSGIPTQEISTLHARAVASGRGTRWMVGVSAQGMTTAPDAQAVLAARSQRAARGRRVLRAGDRPRAGAHSRRLPRPAQHRHAPPRLPRGLRARVRRRRDARDRRGRDVERDLRAHEAQRRGGGGRAGAPASTRGRRLRARDDRRRRRALRRPARRGVRLRRTGQHRDDPPPSPDRRPCRAVGRAAPRARTGEPVAPHTSTRQWLEGA